MSREDFTVNNFEEASAKSAENQYEGKTGIISGEVYHSATTVLSSEGGKAAGVFISSNTSTNLHNAPSCDLSKPDEDLMVCAFCGAHNLAGSNFCMVCGKRLNQTVGASQAFSNTKAEKSSTDPFFLNQPDFLAKTDHIPQDFRNSVLADGENYRSNKEKEEKTDENSGEKSGKKANDKIGTVVVGYQDTDKQFVPVLTRIKTNERTVIDKAVFKIGTAVDTCNMVITGNRYISRIHAYIVVRNDRYFIIDRNSTNKTYVDGKAIPTETEVEIFDNTPIKFANEDMMFNVEQVGNI